jgi:hypothetical protein
MTQSGHELFKVAAMRRRRIVHGLNAGLSRTSDEVFVSSIGRPVTKNPIPLFDHDRKAPNRDVDHSWPWSVLAN